jgi:hypothetical protein
VTRKDDHFILLILATAYNSTAHVPYYTQLTAMANFVQKLDSSHIDHHLTKEQDDVHCDPPSGINVLIIGAGVGGLVAALECHRKGHNVRIWERSESAVAGGEQRALPFLRTCPRQD